MTSKDEIIEMLTKKNEALSLELITQKKISLMWENDRDHWKKFTKDMIDLYNDSFTDAGKAFDAIKTAFKEEPFSDAVEEIDKQANIHEDTFKCTIQVYISKKARLGPSTDVSKWDPTDHNECYCGLNCKITFCKDDCKCFNFCKAHALFDGPFYKRFKL